MTMTLLLRRRADYCCRSNDNWKRHGNKQHDSVLLLDSEAVVVVGTVHRRRRRRRFPSWSRSPAISFLLPAPVGLSIFRTKCKENRMNRIVRGGKEQMWRYLGSPKSYSFRTSSFCVARLHSIVLRRGFRPNFLPATCTFFPCHCLIINPACIQRTNKKVNKHSPSATSSILVPEANPPSVVNGEGNSGLEEEGSCGAR